MMHGQPNTKGYESNYKWCEVKWGEVNWTEWIWSVIIKRLKVEENDKTGSEEK